MLPGKICTWGRVETKHALAGADRLGKHQEISECCISQNLIADPPPSVPSAWYLNASRLRAPPLQPWPSSPRKSRRQDACVEMQLINRTRTMWVIRLMLALREWDTNMRGPMQ